MPESDQPRLQIGDFEGQDWGRGYRCSGGQVARSRMAEMGRAVGRCFRGERIWELTARRAIL